MHKEMQLRYKEFVESKLAVSLLSYQEYFNAVKKVSAAIVQLITTNKETVIKAIESNPEIIAELRSPYFGSIYDKTEHPASNNVLNEILSVLSSAKSSLDNIMQIHCIFTHRIHSLLPTEKISPSFNNTAFSSSLFNTRCRINKQEKPKPTHKLGIATHPVFSKMLGSHPKQYVRALDKFDPDYTASFFKDLEGKIVPVVCGPSGHTRTLLRGAMLYGNLNIDELKAYAFACFVFLTAGGNHSFYEVMSVANLFGTNFEIDCYASAIPDSIKLTDEFRELEKRFPSLSA